MMQEKKNKQRAIILVALLLATAGMLWLNSQGESPVVNKDLFKTADLTTINEVVLRTSTGATQLKFSGSQWRVNDQFDADRNMVDVLFATLRQAEPRRPVAVTQRDSVANRLEKEGVEVTLISGGEKIDVFYAGGNRQKTQAYFMRPGEEPYIVTIPGYRVYTAGIFELAGQGWRSRYVFGFNWRNFSSLETKYPAAAADGFRVELNDQYFGIRGLTLEQTNTARLNSYLDAVSLLQVKEYQDPSPALDSLGKTTPLFLIEVNDVGGTTYTLEVFPYPQGSQPAGTSRKALPVIGRIDQTAWAFFRENDLLSLNRPKAFFSRE
ncbi:DUF4340 domain-containing protein [Dawidia soli]|uniref:DUF4340 domain-containing protein n=1 Tax=Dawidia soli TaxID=2782352 RepID=A0AAP2GC34_9BACT|nr:DUF4340 domain-containing protein [Dawidia soli]MBT1685849.1 DUF4340 domain-containing protein [Dawidia soli]